MAEPRIFRYAKTSPEIIRPAVMMYVRYPLSLRNVEDLLHERGIEIAYESVRFNLVCDCFLPTTGQTPQLPITKRSIDDTIDINRFCPNWTVLLVSMEGQDKFQ